MHRPVVKKLFKKRTKLCLKKNLSLRSMFSIRAVGYVIAYFVTKSNMRLNFKYKIGLLLNKGVGRKIKEKHKYTHPLFLLISILK